MTAEFTVGEDAVLVFNACGGGNGVAEDVYLDDLRLVELDGAYVGIAFLMQSDAQGVRQYIQPRL